MRRPLLVIALAAALTPAAVADAAPRTCQVRGSVTEAQNAFARVYSRPMRGHPGQRVLAACLWSRGREDQVSQSLESRDLDYGWKNVRLARRWVAFEFDYDEVGREDDQSWITVDSLSQNSRDLVEGNVAGRALVLAPTGTAAWVQPPRDGVSKLLVFDSEGRRTLDRGRISPASLSLRGQTLRWTNGGERRSSTLP